MLRIFLTFFLKGDKAPPLFASQNGKKSLATFFADRKTRKAWQRQTGDFLDSGEKCRDGWLCQPLVVWFELAAFYTASQNENGVQTDSVFVLAFFVELEA